ncbi:MFS transporter, partial [Escherichia coli]
LWEKGSPLHKSTQQVRTQGPIRHADCRQRKLADFLCTGGIIQDPITCFCPVSC